MPLTQLSEMQFGIYEIGIILAIISILYFIVKEAYKIFQIKTVCDEYIDGRIDCKVMPVKEEVTCLKEWQSINQKDIQDIKIEMTKISTSLEYIVLAIKDYKKI